MYTNPAQMEPLFPKTEGDLSDLALKVFSESAKLSEMIHPLTRDKIVALLRHINSYYSNRIEGEHTTPADIERAVRQEFSSNEKNKRLQLLSLAHIQVQKKIDKRLDKEDLEVVSTEFIRWIHKEFYENVPEEFRIIKNPTNDEELRLIPGELRQREVYVGDHLAPSAESLHDFMRRFEDVYRIKNLYGHKKLVAAVASHHRLAWIHPFLDGNGRVGRLFTYAFMRKTSLDSVGLWTLSRGLARSASEYKRMLALADGTRQGNYDGRGNLTEKGLVKFCEYIFNTALDQIKFMKSLLNLDELYNRISGYVQLRSQNMLPGENPLRIEAKYILTEVMMRGQVKRGEVARITGLGDRTARELTSQLLDEELLASSNHKKPLQFNIPPKVVGYYFPSLYPEGTI
jgi:Fic family protein